MARDRLARIRPIPCAETLLFDTCLEDENTGGIERDTAIHGLPNVVRRRCDREDPLTSKELIQTFTDKFFRGISLLFSLWIRQGGLGRALP